MKLNRMFAAVAASIMVLAGCNSAPPTVRGVIIDAQVVEDPGLYAAVWTAGLKLPDGSVIGLEAHADGDLLGTKVHVGDCVEARASADDSNIGNADNIKVLPASSC